MARNNHHGCCALIHLQEDNARFILLAIVMVLYMLTGAGIFMFLERDNETIEKTKYQKIIDDFYKRNPSVNRTDLEYLLKHYTEGYTAGFLGKVRPRWDFSGSFYFVGTVVSTIGRCDSKIGRKCR